MSRRPPRTQRPKTTPVDSQGVVTVVLRLIAMVERLFKSATDTKVVIAVIAAGVAIYAITMFALPPADRLTGARLFSGAISDIRTVVTSNPMAWAGWAIAALLLLAGAPFVVYQHRRIHEQGEELSGHRNSAKPERLSSRQPEQLSLYETRARSKFQKGGDDS